jgi:hypothetical protein
MSDSRTRRLATTRILSLVAVLLLGLLSSGCNVRERLTERAVESVAGRVVGGDVDIDSSGESLRIQTDEGTVEFGGGSGSLPDAFPSEFPVPGDAEIEYATSASTDDGAFFSVIAFTSDSYDDTVAWYEQQLGSSGWSIDGQTQFSSGDGQTQSFTVSGHGYNGAVTIHDANEDGAQRTGIQLHIQSADESQ